MAATTGSIAKLEWAPEGTSPTYTEIPLVGTATISMNRPALEITALGDVNTSYLAGVQTTTASLDIFYDATNANHKELFDNLNEAEGKIFIRLYLDDSVTNHIAGLAQVTNFDITATSGDVTRASVQLQFSGEITATIP